MLAPLGNEFVYTPVGSTREFLAWRQIISTRGFGASALCVTPTASMIGCKQEGREAYRFRTKSDKKKVVGLRLSAHYLRTNFPLHPQQATEMGPRSEPTKVDENNFIGIKTREQGTADIFKTRQIY